MQLEEFENINQDDEILREIYSKLKVLISKKKICEAEDLMFENISIDKNKENLKLAIWFYNQINGLPDSILEENNFFRDEIIQGLKDICKMYEIQMDFFI